MKRQRLTTYQLGAAISDQTFWSSQLSFARRKSLLVRIEDADGCVGWGEGGQYGPAEPVDAMVHDVLWPMLCEHDGDRPRDFWHAAYALLRDYARAGSGIEALSAVEMALWDLLARRQGVPLYALWGGGRRTRIPVYATGLYVRGRAVPPLDRELAQLRDEAHGYRERGFEAVKMKVGLYRPGEDLRRVDAVREAIGGDTVLLVDANHAYTPAVAVTVGRALAERGVYWFEEPVVPEDLAGYRFVRERAGLAIAGGECAYTRFGFAELIKGGCVDIVQPDLCCAGGPGEVLRIADAAWAAGVQCVPHVWGSGIAIAAGLQLHACLPPMPYTARPAAVINEPVLEWDCNPNPLRTELLREPIEPRGGYVGVPAGPGLGVEVDEAALRRYGLTTRESRYSRYS